MEPITMMLLSAMAASTLGSTAVSQIEGKRNRRFQRNQSSSAHQREMQDLKLAGLNPLLTGGTRGASTPPGGQAAPAKSLEGAVSSAAQFQSTRNQSKLISAQSQAALSQSNLNQANTAKSLMEARKIASETKTITGEESRRTTAFPTEMAKIKQDISASKTLQSKHKTEIRVQLEHLKKLKFTRKLYDLGNMVTPEALTIKRNIKKIIKFNKDLDKKFDEFWEGTIIKGAQADSIKNRINKFKKRQ